MTEAAPTPLTVESAKCQRRDLGPYLWTELLPFPYYAPPIGCRFAWVSGCLVPDPDHPAPVTPVVPTPIPRQPPPPRETGEDDEAYAVRVARQELVRAVGPTAIARGHVEVDEQKEGWLVVVRDANAVCGEDPADAGGCQFRTGPDRLRDVYVCVLRETWATPVEGLTDRAQPYAVTGRECRPGLF
jgi:hypothetical protein